MRSPNQRPSAPATAVDDRTDNDEALARVTATTLLAARPLLLLVDALEREIMLLRTLTPRSDVPDALAATLGRLKASIGESATGDVWVTTDEVARITGLSQSAVTWRIRKGRIHAEWRGGRWWVHRTDVEGV